MIGAEDELRLALTEVADNQLLVEQFGPGLFTDVTPGKDRRVALDPAGHPLEPTSDVTGAFSEMALYVLVRRDQTWWLAAGQNTPLRPQPT